MDNEQSDLFPLDSSVPSDLLEPLGLTLRERILIKILLENENLTNKHIAGLMGVSSAVVGKLKDSPRVQKALSILLATTDEVLEKAQVKAVWRLLQLLDHEDPKIVLGAIRTVMQAKQTIQPANPIEISWTTKINEDGSLTQSFEQKMKDERLLKAVGEGSNGSASGETK